MQNSNMTWSVIKNPQAYWIGSYTDDDLFHYFLEQPKDYIILRKNNRESKPKLQAEYAFLSFKTLPSMCCNWVPGDVRREVKNALQWCEIGVFGENNMTSIMLSS